MRNDGEVKWHLNDLDVATVEEMNPEGAMEVQNLRALGMGWAWYVNDLSKYLPDAETLADMTPAEDDSVGIDPEIPLKDIDLEPEVDLERETSDPYVIDVPFPHVSPGPADTKLMGGDAPALLPRSQDVDLVVSAINVPLPSHLRKALKTWSREDLHVRVFQGVRAGGPKARQVCCRETFDMETGSLLAREYFDPGKGPARLPTRPSLIALRPALILCLFVVSFGTLRSTLCLNLFVLLRRVVVLVPVLHAAASFLSLSSGGRVCQHRHQPERQMCRRTGEWVKLRLLLPERHLC